MTALTLFHISTIISGLSFFYVFYKSFQYSKKVAKGVRYYPVIRVHIFIGLVCWLLYFASIGLVNRLATLEIVKEFILMPIFVSWAYAHRKL